MRARLGIRVAGDLGVTRAYRPRADEQFAARVAMVAGDPLAARSLSHAVRWRAYDHARVRAHLLERVALPRPAASIRCACVSDSPRECVSRRYTGRRTGGSTGHDYDERCPCACHDEREEGDRYDYDW